MARNRYYATPEYKERLKADYRARAAVLDELGIRGSKLRVKCRHASGFEDVLRAHGHDPAKWPHLTIRRIGGRPRLPDDDKLIARRRRYRILRDNGATAYWACAWASSQKAFARGMQALRDAKKFR